MISFRSGCLSTSAERLVVALLRLVVAVDDVDQLELGVLRVLERLLACAAIQAFWLAASGEAERMANLPPSGAEDVERHVGHDLAGLGEVDLGDEDVLALRRTGSASPSHDLDAGLACAALAAGTIWSPELLEIMTALTPCVVALVTISIWPATLFSGVRPEELDRRRVLQLLRRLLGALVRLVEAAMPASA